MNGNTIEDESWVNKSVINEMSIFRQIMLFILAR